MFLFWYICGRARRKTIVDNDRMLPLLCHSWTWQPWQQRGLHVHRWGSRMSPHGISCMFHVGPCCARRPWEQIACHFGFLWPWSVIRKSFQLGSSWSLPDHLLIQDQSQLDAISPFETRQAQARSTFVGLVTRDSWLDFTWLVNRCHSHSHSCRKQVAWVGVERLVT